MTQGRKAEECSLLRLSTQSPLNGANSFFNFRLGVVLILLREILMRPCVRANAVAGLRNATQYFRIISGVLADSEEGCSHALIRQRLQHGAGGWPRAVVERQDDLLIAQEVMLLEVLETETRAASGINLNGSGDTERT